MQVALGILAAGLVIGLVYWIRRSFANEVTLSQTDAALKVEQQRVSKMESAAVQERQERAQELDEKAAAVRTADDAARLLRDQFRAGR